MTDLHYVAQCDAALASGAITQPENPHYCPECNQVVSRSEDVNGWHKYTSQGVLVVACEGYYVIDPNLVGVPLMWHDWRDPRYVM
jgi:hypothetical protein